MYHNPLDYLKIAGDDKHNAEVQKRFEQAQENARYQESLEMQRKANAIAQKSLEQSQKATRLSVWAIVISTVLSVASIILSLVL